MNADTLRFDGRVAVITGAGGGLGKAYALLLASRGASVVVNDLGIASVKGEGNISSSAADLVVEEIRKLGGKAIANYDSVENGDKIIETALVHFGRVDILINNAGILRDKSFGKMTDLDWDLVHKIHLRGSYKVTKAAWSSFQRQGYGRIIMIVSAAGIYGNFGQANYSSAKAALIGFSNALAQEGKKYHITCNAIAPMAGSRMTETVLPESLMNVLKPEYVAPLVAFLCHESVSETGSLFETGAGYIAKVRWERSKGVLFKLDGTFTPGAIALRWKDIGNFQGADHPMRISEVNWMHLVTLSQKLDPNSEKESLNFKGKVVLITGAGTGLGRAYAHYFAKLGASVVVNDIGTVSSSRTTVTRRTADLVAEEIQKLGGIAHANHDSVEFGKRIVEDTLRVFGRIDVLVNNAGILRDRSFTKMTDAEWDSIQEIHLYGTFRVSQAAWEPMQKQQYGRIINTSSAVGLYGNFGQTNYSSAKSGIIGLTRVMALEGKRFNILVNAVAPNAGTSMTATVMTPEMLNALKPDFIAPLVAYLAHDRVNETGGVFEVGSGWIAKMRYERTRGIAFSQKTDSITMEKIAQAWPRIIDFTHSTHPNNIQDSMEPIHNMITLNDTKREPAELTPANSDQIYTKGVNIPSFENSSTSTYTAKDVILYALGVGANPQTDLHLVYENHENFVTLPSFGVILAFPCLSDLHLEKILPKFNPMMLLHGEHYLELCQPLPTSGTLKSKATIVEVLDKGKGAIVVIGVATTNSKGEMVCYNEFTNFIRGAGEFGGPKTSQRKTMAATVIHEMPSRKPDWSVKEKIGENQAVLYRLSGDLNPLHIDSSVSTAAGFDRPILHGLCTLGYAARQIFHICCHNDSKLFKSIKVRFARHVFPGETLRTEIWKEGDRVLFQVYAHERGTLVISNAAVDLNKSSASMKAPGSSPFACSQFFDEIRSVMLSKSAKEREAQVKKVQAIFQFDIVNSHGDKQTWYIDLKQGGGNVDMGQPALQPDLSITTEDTVFMDMVHGKLNGQKAFLSGKLKAKGKLGLASQLDALFKEMRGSKL